MDKIIFHIDFDYFYAQCEEIRRPEFEDKTCAVCVYSDRGGDSGAIATANYLPENMASNLECQSNLQKRN